MMVKSEYYFIYHTPNNFDNLVMLSDGENLNGLYFLESERQKEKIKEKYINKDLSIFISVQKWLDMYFSGVNPNFTPQISNYYSSSFQKEVLDITKEIPYGKTITYGDIASLIAKRRSIKKMSSQAVGNALGANQICLIFPCQRVIGKSGKLTGYHGGLKNKENLLIHEQNKDFKN